MKVILMQDVPNIGQKFEVKEVADGFAVNFLIPKGKAQFADKGTVEKIKAQMEKETLEKQKQTSSLKRALEEQKTFEIRTKVNEEGHLFAKVDNSKLAGVISEQINQEISDGQIDLEQPIKEVGEHVVNVRVGDESVEVTIKIQAE